MLYLDETCEQNGVLLRKSAGQTMPEKKTLSWRLGKELDMEKKIGACSCFLVKGDGTESSHRFRGNRPYLGKGLSVPERI